MSLVVHLTEPPELKERIPFEPRPPGLDRRWPQDRMPEFLEQLRNFTRATHFAGFMKNQSDLYKLTVDRARKLIQSEAHLEWFDQFFGARPGADFKIVISLLNGPSNYGASLKVKGREELYCILGAWRVDAAGQPVFEPRMLGTVVHEFCHSYVNPLVYAHTAQLENAGQKLFAQVKGSMQRQAYGNWTTMMHESVVRASVIRYTQTYNGLGAAALATAGEVSRGFLWMPELVELLGRYEKQREKYPRFTDFFDEVVKFFDDYPQAVETKS